MPNRYSKKATRTKYKGRWYRSATEARWAAWFSSKRLVAVYEHKVEGVYYLPDFLVGECYLEVKPARWLGYPQVPSEWINKGISLVKKTAVPLVIVFGHPSRTCAGVVIEKKRVGLRVVVTLEYIESMGEHGVLEYLKAHAK